VSESTRRPGATRPLAASPGPRPGTRAPGPRPRPSRVPRKRFLLPLLAALAAALLVPSSRTPPPVIPDVLPPVELAPRDLRTWRTEVRRVEEARGEPIGQRARLVVPPQLQHDADRRMFLAVQVAETQEQDYELPGDDADLAALVQAGEMVELPPFGDHHVLYGVGALVDGAPFAHYDREAATEVPLYSSYLDFDLADDAYDAAVGELQDKKAALAAARDRARRSPRQRRALSAQLRSLEQRETLLIRQQERTAEYYEDWERRQMLAGKLQLLEDVANRLGGRRYDLEKPEDRRALRGRLQTFIRPEARAVLLEIAREYSRVFDRPLPVTSLVRSYRYQTVLRRTNRNATSIDVPPHSTGLAFDLMTRFMTAAEQEYLMALVARLEDEGKVEALREGNRDHLHVFAFADGVRPPAAAIARSLELVAPRPAPRPARVARPAAAQAPMRSYVPSGPRLSAPALPN
jgi:hypothetical protein